MAEEHKHYFLYFNLEFNVFFTPFTLLQEAINKYFRTKNKMFESSH